MTAVFLASLIGGLLLGVRVMLFGVERTRPAGDATEPSFRVSPAVITTFAILFGSVGYLALKLGAGPGGAALTAAVVAALGGAATVRLVNKWWRVPVEHDVDDPRYVLQGHLARVTAAIPEGSEGAVAIEATEGSRVLRARAVDGGTLAEGTEVVIDRLEDELAFVEAWVEVEKRL